MGEKEQILPMPTNIEQIKSKIGQGNYKLVLFLLDEYKHLTKRKARRVISKKYNIDINIIKEIQNQ